MDEIKDKASSRLLDIVALLDKLNKEDMTKITRELDNDTSSAINTGLKEARDIMFSVFMAINYEEKG